MTRAGKCVRRPVHRRPHLVVITDMDGNVERLRSRDRHAAYMDVRRLAIRRLYALRLTEFQCEREFWKLHRITIRVAS